jgi:hypothetical protein
LCYFFKKIFLLLFISPQGIVLTHTRYDDPLET